MYTLVLLTALTAGDQSPQWLFHHGCCGYSCCGYSCHGCCGYGGCHGCCGYSCHGCCGYGGCHGCCGWGGCHGCCGYSGCGGCHGCCGYYGCAGSCYGSCYGYGYAGWGHGCWGAPYGCYGPAWDGGGCGGVYSMGYAPGPLVGAPIMPAPAGTPAPSKVEPEEKKKKDETAARLEVNLPKDAKLFVDDRPITVTEGKRVFNTPALEKGQTYYYEVRAEVMVDGKPVSETRRVIIKAGEVAREDFRDLKDRSAVASADKDR